MSPRVAVRSPAAGPRLDGAQEGEALVSQVLDEIGISMGQQLAAVPSAQPAGAGKEAAEAAALPALEGAVGAGGGGGGAGGGGGGADESSALDKELQARLDNLRKT